jgi:recombination protein RecT
MNNSNNNGIYIGTPKQPEPKRASAMQMKVMQIIESRREQFDEILTNMPTETFISACKVAVNKKARDIHDGNLQSLIETFLKLARDGLLPDDVEAVLMCYGGMFSYLPTYRGILKKLYETNLKHLACRVVYEKDHFRFRQGDSESIEHEPFMPMKSRDERGQVIAVYCIATNKDGAVFREIVYKYELDQISTGKGRMQHIWKQWYDEMAKKTVIKRLAKRYPSQDSSLQAVLKADDEAQGFVPSEANPALIKKINSLSELLEKTAKKEVDNVGNTSTDDKGASGTVAVENSNNTQMETRK